MRSYVSAHWARRIASGHLQLTTIGVFALVGHAQRASGIVLQRALEFIC